MYLLTTAHLALHVARCVKADYLDVRNIQATVILRHLTVRVTSSHAYPTRVRRFIAPASRSRPRMAALDHLESAHRRGCCADSHGLEWLQ